MRDLLKDARNSSLRDECIKTRPEEEIVLKDGKTRFFIKNETRSLVRAPVYTAKVDDCLMSAERGVQKCDFMVNKKGAAVVLLVELKGKDPQDAAGQLKSAQKFLCGHLPGFYKYVHILVHKIPSTKIQSVKSENPLIMECTNNSEETIEDLMRGKFFPTSEAVKYKSAKQTAKKGK